ncbi:hypothetical protein FOZ63_011161 [Perkinsus olseni]|uniref:Uncharacterized protein n=1 Tax=Perkinsus olseni TaxID=32597 RepID=A0A7J6RR68_PEROL|nr:hypothetical protein FOZ63_011161 [Perkinsus olseni]
MTALATTVRNLGLPSFHSLVTDKLLRDRPDGKKALADLKDVCGTVKWGMIGEFGSFYGACDTYGDLAEAAVNTADLEIFICDQSFFWLGQVYGRGVRLGGDGILTGAARVLSLIARASVESSLGHLFTSAWVPNDLYFSVVGGCLA